MCPQEIYHVLMHEIAGFCKTSVDVRYWLIPSVRTGSNAGRRGQVRPSAQSDMKRSPRSKRDDLFCVPQRHCPARYSSAICTATAPSATAVTT